MNTKTRQLIIFIGGFFLFCLDQLIKFLAREIFTTNYTWLNFFGWQPFFNHGVAFSLPLPNLITIVITIPILIIILAVILNFFKRPQKMYYFLGLTLILWGALSNLLDRIIFKTTIDYILIGTGVINLSDISIVIGFLFYLIPSKFFKT